MEALKDFVKCRTANQTFLEFMENRIESRTDVRPVSKKSHRTSLHVLQLYRKIEQFSDLTPAKFKRFDSWLHNHYDNQTTIYAIHKAIKAYINEAKRAELITSNPYDYLKISRGKTSKRRYLTEEEMNLIKSAPLKNDGQRKCRDLFMFQCYTGLAYADLSRFDFTKTINRDGRYVIVDSRSKTDEDFYLVLLAPAVEILERYNFTLPAVSNQSYNRTLKLIAANSGLDVEITSHMARHSFAVYAINHGIPIEILARMMGHTDIKTTQLYAKIVDKTIESAFDRLDSSWASSKR